MAKKRFTFVTEEMLEGFDECGVTRREERALIALMHHRPNASGEIGVHKGADGTEYVMSAEDIAKYARLASKDVAWHAISGLKRKGVIRESRDVRKNGSRYRVYALTEKWIGYASLEDDDSSDMQTHDGARVTDSAVSNILTNVSGTTLTAVSDTPLSNPISTQENENVVPVGTRFFDDVDEETTSSKPMDFSDFDPVFPKIPYPQSLDEVRAFAAANGTGYVRWASSEDWPLVAFWEVNTQNGWVIDGKIVYDWHGLLKSFCEKARAYADARSDAIAYLIDDEEVQYDMITLMQEARHREWSERHERWLTYQR